MKYLFFFKGHPLLLCCVCFLVCNSRFFERVTYKNKKNLPFHRRIYRRTITRRYFTESCKKITGFCHIHRRIYRRPITRRYFTESCKKITGFCHIHRRLSDGVSDANTDGITDGIVRTHVWHVSVCTITDDITDVTYRRPAHVWHVSRLHHHRRHFRRIEKFGGIFELFWCAFQLISDGN